MRCWSRREEWQERRQVRRLEERLVDRRDRLEYNIRLFKLNEVLNLNFSIIVQYIDMEI